MIKYKYAYLATKPSTPEKNWVGTYLLSQIKWNVPQMVERYLGTV